jgi:hypothetical protein
MAIVQISKIQQRAGNLVDLPQLDNGEFGWATDENRLFIGRTGNTYTDENIEVLTSYSDISFSQINGSGGGNFNITSPSTGQILTYIASTNTWENYKGNSSQLNGTKLQLGNVANISMSGGAIGYVLQTDGSGNLSWTPQGTLYTPIIALSNATPIVMTVSPTTPYTNNAEITITGVDSVSNTIVNGQAFKILLASNYPTTGNVSLYYIGNSNPVPGTGIASYVANSGIATTTSAGGGGNIGPSSDTQVQFNDGGVVQGDSNFTFAKSTHTLTVASGYVITANVNASYGVTSPVFVSNVTTGTAPLTVTSTTLVPNLYVARANVSEYANTALTTTGTWYPIFVNATSGNLAQGANANLSFNAATGGLSATLLTGTLTTAAQPNITSTGTLTSLTVTGNISAGNLVGPHANGNSNIAITQNANITFTAKSNSTMVISDTGANITGTANVSGNANVGNLGTTTLIATTGNITTINSGLLQNGNSNVTITTNANLTFTAKSNSTMVISDTGANITGTANISGNANVGNLGTAGQIISTIATGTAPFTVTSTTRVANLNVDQSNIANYANVVTNINGTWYPTFVNGNTTANYQLASNANLSFNSTTGALSATLFAGNGSSLTALAGGNVTGTVPNANVTTYGAVTVQSTGTFYPVFVNATSGNLAQGANANLSFNAATGNLSTTILSATYLRGDGSNITNLSIAAGTTIVNGTSNVSIPASGGNINTVVAGNTTLVVTGTGANITGTANISGNANVGNIGATNGVFTNVSGNGANLSSITGGNVTGTVANATYAVSAGSATTAGTVTTNAQSNITSVGILTGLTLTNAAIISVGSNTNVGTFTGNFSLSAGSRLNATYADLAEYYEADKPYEAGTVLEFGGEKEVTIAEDGTTRVAGVVSTDPAYVMNSSCVGEHIVALALQGRVPCKVRGTIRKGDMLVSGGNGFARPSQLPVMGMVIGKSLENFEGEGIIEVAVGRL